MPRRQRVDVPPCLMTRMWQKRQIPPKVEVSPRSNRTGQHRATEAQRAGARQTAERLVRADNQNSSAIGDQLSVRQRGPWRIMLDRPRNH